MFDITFSSGGGPIGAPASAHLDRAVSEANRGLRARTVAGLSARQVAEKLQTPSGVWEKDGGGVASSYGYAANVAAVGMAWFTDANGVRHVRVIGTRKQTQSAHVPTVFEGTRSQHAIRHPAVLVYPKLIGWAVNLTKAEVAKKSLHLRGLIETCRENPLDSLSRSALADLLTEGGNTSAAKLERAAAEFADRLVHATRSA